MKVSRLVCLMAALMAASGLAQTSQPPPSTGSEFPSAPASRPPRNAEAKQLLAKVLADARAPKRDCSKLISPWTRVLLDVAAPTSEDVKKELDAYLWLARCAEKQRYFVLLADLGNAMLDADPQGGHPELLARAYLGLNSPKLALGVLQRAEKTSAKDPDVAVTTAKVLCRTRQWSECLKAADKTLTLVTKPQSPDGKEILNRAQKYRARAQLHLGKLDEAAKAVALSGKLGGDAADLAEVRKAMVPAKTYRAVVEVETSPMVALGIFHLLGKRADSRGLARFQIDNIGDDRQFKVEASIDGVTSTQTKVETLLKGQSATIDLTPQLAPGFDATALHAARTAQLDLKVSVLTPKGDLVVFQDSQGLELEPRDFLPTASFVDDEKAANQDQLNYIAAWVTPGHKAIETFLSEAKQRAPRQTFAGEQAATIPQVKALFDTLQAKGLSYVMNPDVLSGTGYGQRARLPADVLASTNAQCLEGAILYAALMEAIGLQPAIVIVPGHAFVAWRTSPRDVLEPRPDGGVRVDDGGTADAGAPADAGLAVDGGVSDADAGAIDAGAAPEVLVRTLPGQLQFLETTMTHDGTFVAAANTGLREYMNALISRNARVLRLADLRRQGIAPQPYE